MKTLNSWKLVPAVAGAILLGALATLPARAQSFSTLLQGQSPVDWWKFDETNASPAINSVANLGSAGAAATGYVMAAGYPVTGTNGIVGNGVYISNPGQDVGFCYSRIDIPNLPSLNPDPPFTVEFWAMPNSPFDPSDATGICPVSSDSPFPGDGSRSGYLFYVNPSAWVFRVGGEAGYAAVVTASGTVSTNSFTHVVGEFDGATATLYINGVLAASVSAAGGGPFHRNIWAPTRIGGGDLGGNATADEYADGNGYSPYGQGTRGWDGWFDEFAFYNTILSSNVIMSHYMAGTNHSTPAVYDSLILASSPVGYWNFDEPAYTPPSPSSYTFAADSGSLGFDGTNTVGTLADQPGVPGTGDKSVYFNGVAGSLVLDTNTPALNVGGQNLTLAAWINPTSFGYVSDIIAQGYDETNYVENFLRVGDSFDWSAFQDDASGGNYNPAVVPDVPFYEIGAYDGGPGYVSAVYPAPVGDLGHWVFLVGTFDGANWNLYRNGNLVAQFSGAWADGSPAGPAAVVAPSDPSYVHPWSVGSRSNPNEYFGMFFNGSIAEPAILTTALDAATISNLYNSVALPPVITQAPSVPSPAYVGSSATISVWAEGPGPLSYQWYTNGTLVPGQTATNWTLNLNGLTAANDATYTVIVTNASGAATSSVVLLVEPLPPLVVGAASETRWVGFPLSFSPVNLVTTEPFTFQWEINGNPIAGATQSSYSAPASTAGGYTLVISNSTIVLTSSVATLSVLTPPNNYVSNVLADHPLSYYRLDETSGTIAYDDAGGNNGDYVGTVTLGVPGYSLLDPDTAVLFPGTPESYVGDIGATTINFSGTNAEFSIEAWANGPALQVTGDTGAALIAKGHGNNGATADEQFALVDNIGAYAFFVRDAKGNAAVAKAATGPDGFWHHLVGVCDYQGLGGPAGLTLYIDGAPVAASPLPGSLIASGIINSEADVSIGSESSQPSPTYDLTWTGTIDEVAIYATNLSATQVSNHYAARYGPDLAPIITTAPVSVTNYVTLPASLSIQVAGTVPVTYQWYHGSTLIAGATADTLTIPNLAYTDAGSYTVAASNVITTGATGIVSAPVTITVLAPPSNPPAISGLVMHLTFDNTLVDATGRGNNATNEASGGATLETNSYVPGMIGEAFSYQTTLDPTTNANYASVGIRPDLQFGSNVNFTVSMWVQVPQDYVGGDLPFFCDVIGSTFSFPGFCFEPSYGLGGWGFSVFDNNDAGQGDYGAQGSINDGNWHSLVYVIDRTAGATIYEDGTNALGTVEEGTSVIGIGNINSPDAATIGQDPTGLYPVAGSGYIDDLGVWRRALAPLEAASIYMAGISNHISFVGGAAPPTFTLQVQPGSILQMTWSAGNLQGTTNLTGPWTNVVGATSPYTNAPTGTQQFFRIEE